MAKATLHVSLIRPLIRTKSTSGGKEMRGFTFMALITSYGDETHSQHFSANRNTRMFRGRSLSHVGAGLDVVQVQVPDDVVHSCILQTFWPVVGWGQGLSHTQLELTVGQFCCLKAFLKQGAVIKICHIPASQRKSSSNQATTSC